MGLEEKKKQLHQFIEQADEETTNVLMETIAEYQSAKDFEIPQEWIDEANEVLAKVESGEMETYTIEECKKMMAEKKAKRLNQNGSNS